MDNLDFKSDTLDKWEITSSNGEVETVIGEEIPRDKMVSEIASGYVYYFKTTDGLRSFSAFNHTIKQIKEIT